MATTKAFVLDTNVLLHNAQSIESFQDNDVVIPMAVIEELDKFKKGSDELGRNARQVIRHLDKLRQSANKPGQLRNGIPLSHISVSATGKLFVLTDAELGNGGAEAKIREVFRLDLSAAISDNRILKVAYALQEQGRHVVFISKDINLRLKADAIGLRVMDFERGKVDERGFYTGFQQGKLSAAELDSLYKGNGIPSGARSLLTNEFVLFTSEGNSKQSALARLRSNNMIEAIDMNRTNRVWNVAPRNKEQRMAFDLLLDPEIRLVTLVGGAGTGKTLLALAAALQLVLRENAYERILVSRPIVPLGNDIGFLPGDKDAKLSSWMQPIFDNLDFLLGGEEEDRKAKSASRNSVPNLMNSGKLELEALTYIRGRSIPRQFVVVDEAQNLTPHEVKTIISRAGEGTKLVLTGDPRQIDNPYLDASSNGLCYAADRMKGQSLFGHVMLAHSERSELAALAAKLL